MFDRIINNVCRIVYVIGIVFFACQVSAKYTFTNYVNNSQCLLGGNQVGCLLDSSVAPGDSNFTVHLPINWQVTNGHGSKANVRLYWSPDSDFTKLMKVTSHKAGWKPVQVVATSAQNDNYSFRIWDGHDPMSRLEITAEAVLVHRNGGVPNKTKACTGKLQLGTQFYTSNIGSANGLWCYTDDDYFIKDIRLNMPTISLQLKVNKEGATDRLVRVPVIQIGAMVDGYNVGNGSYIYDYQHKFYSISNVLHLRMNDRQCKLEIPAKDLTFKTLQAMPQGKMKLEEQSTSLNVTCAGYRDPELETQDQMRYGLGIANDLVGVKIRSTSGHHDNNSKTIGLQSKTADGSIFTRKDLYVEASFTKDQDCSVNPLMTDGTTNNFSQKINLPGKKESEHGDSTIYWRLCTPSPTEPLTTGKYNGSAMISVEYQ